MTMNRRTWTMAGVATLAAGAGVGWALRGEPGAPEGLWGLRFETPVGGELRMADFLGRPLVLNFWATWCPPCVREMPTLDRFHRGQPAGGWQVLGLAVDNRAAVREFLRRTPVAFPIGLAGFGGTELSRQLGNTSGALPFTVVFDADGRAKHRKHGETSAAELEAWARTPG